MVIKRITRGLCGCAIAGILFLCCEKFNGPEPILLEYRSQFVTASGQSFQLNSLNRIAISDAGIYVVVNNPAAEDGSGTDLIPIDIASVGKIIFQ